MAEYKSFKGLLGSHCKKMSGAELEQQKKLIQDELARREEVARPRKRSRR
jgi:hypothetical protein